MATRKRTTKKDVPADESPDVSYISEYGKVGWGCTCGWKPNYEHSMGLGLQQLRHMESVHGVHGDPIA